MPNAPIKPLTLVGPGFQGLNTQNASAILGPEWAAQAQNCVFDSANRLISRSGWQVLTSSGGGSADFKSVFEYKPAAPTANIIVSAGGNKLYVGTTTLTDVTGAIVPTADNWKFVNFNGNVYGLQAGHPLIQYTGSGNFTAVVAASGAVPNGNELLAAFGRLWGVKSDKQTVQYCNLLDATNWNIAGSGSFNMTSVWPAGADEIVALASINNRLVVFGKKNIVAFNDPSSGGSVIGLNPANLAVIDAIGGIGCMERDSVQHVNGDDLVFLSQAGVQSLSRTIQEKSAPIHDLSKNVRDYMLGSYVGNAVGGTKSCYSPRNGLYLLCFPGQKLLAFDTRIKLQDESWRVTEWTNTLPFSLCALEDGITIYQGSGGKLFQYAGFTDNSNSFRMVYQSGWLDLGEEAANYIKILKRINSIVLFQAGTNPLFKWAFDFSTTFNTFTATSTYQSSGAEYGIGEYGIGEFGGSTTLQNLHAPGLGSGQFIKVGMEVDISTTFLAIQQLELYAKTGRLA